LFLPARGTGVGRPCGYECDVVLRRAGEHPAQQAVARLVQRLPARSPRWRVPPAGPC